MEKIQTSNTRGVYLFRSIASRYGVASKMTIANIAAMRMMIFFMALISLFVSFKCCRPLATIIKNYFFFKS